MRFNGARTESGINKSSGGMMKSFFLMAVLVLNLPSITLGNRDMPVDGGVVTSGVGWRIDPFGSGKAVFHRGIDIAVPVGTPVRATQKGRVVFAGDRGGYGATVIIEHGNGDRTLYGHNALLRVSPGEQVESGTVVAFSGNSGKSTGPHVHFEQIPGGRQDIEVAAADEQALPHRVAADEQRHRLERQMDDSVNSILRTIGRPSAGVLGG